MPMIYYGMNAVLFCSVLSLRVFPGIVGLQVLEYQCGQEFVSDCAGTFLPPSLLLSMLPSLPPLLHSYLITFFLPSPYLPLVTSCASLFPQIVLCSTFNPPALIPSVQLPV